MVSMGTPCRICHHRSVVTGGLTSNTDAYDATPAPRLLFSRIIMVRAARINAASWYSGGVSDVLVVAVVWLGPPQCGPSPLQLSVSKPELPGPLLLLDCETEWLLAPLCTENTRYWLEAILTAHGKCEAGICVCAVIEQENKFSVLGGGWWRWYLLLEVCP